MFGSTERPGEVPTKPRFTLKAILGCTAVLSVPFAVIGAGFPLLGVVILLLVSVGCIAYLAQGRKGLVQAVVAFGIILLIICGWIVCLFLLL